MNTDALKTSDPQKTILFLVPHVFNYTGGAEKVVRQIYHGFVEAGWSVQVMTNKEIGSSLLNYNYRYPGNISTSVAAKISQAAKAATTIYAFGYTALWLLKELHIDKSIVFTPFETEQEDDSYLAGCRQLLLSTAPRIIVFSAYFQAKIRSMGFHSFWIRYNIPQSEIVRFQMARRRHCMATPLKNSSIFVLAPTRISPRKNIEQLILLAEHLIEHNIKVCITGGLGDSTYPHYVKSLVALNNKHGNPIELNQHALEEEEMLRLFSTALAVVSTSNVEGFGIFALESLNFLCPVITFDSNGIKELAENFSDGRGITMVDNTSHMVSTIVALANQPGKDIQQIERSIEEYNKNFSFEQQMCCALKIIEK